MDRRDEPKRVAFVTYNRIGDGEYDNGIIRRDGLEVYIAQNGHRSKWAANDDRYEDRVMSRERSAARVAKTVDLTEMDEVYIYVGADGGEEAIRKTKGLEAKKVTYVMCDCNYGTKQRMVRETGNPQASIRSCECGGRDTLGRILRHILAQP